MAAISIAGTDLEVAEGRELEPILIGEDSRAYAGNLRSSVVTQKRAFTGKTAPTLEATWDTLRAAVANRAQVTCSGIMLSGDSITAAGAVSAELERGTSPARYVISFSGVQV
jgi:hypothetical protein